MACTEPRLTALKIAHKGEIHRLRVDLSAFHYADLMALFAETFTLAPQSFVVQYSDADGDLLNVTSEAEYVEACRVFLQGADSVKALRFSAVSRSHVAFQENVAEPILKAIEKLVETLNAAMEKVKHEQWAQRAQSGVEHTGEVLGRAAKDTGVVLNRAAQDATVALSRAAQDARESFSAARQSIQDIPLDQLLKDTTDGLKAAADGISSLATELVDEIKKLQVAKTQETQSQTEETVTEEAAPQPPVEPEWEQVEQQPTPTAVPVAEEAAVTTLEEAPVVVVAEPEIVVVAAPAVSEEEQKWAEQLAMVRDIFPGVDARRVIDALEQCNGNVQVVLNALMEEM